MKTDDEYKWSTGLSKNPWIWSACRSIVKTLSAPAVVKRFAMSLAPIGTLGLPFLSCLAYPKYGITALILYADALLAASIISNNSNKLSAGGIVDWMIKISAPLIDSVKEGSNSPSLNSIIFWAPNSTL